MYRFLFLPFSYPRLATGTGPEYLWRSLVSGARLKTLPANNRGGACAPLAGPYFSRKGFLDFPYLCLMVF